MPLAKTEQGEINRLKAILTETKLANDRLRLKVKRQELALTTIYEQRGFILETNPDPQVWEAF